MTNVPSAVPYQYPRNDDPREVGAHVVSIEVVGLWSREVDTVEMGCGGRGSIVQDVPVEVTYRHDDLQRVP